MKEKISISLTPEQLQLLDQAAQRQGRSRSDLLGRLIGLWLVDDPANNEAKICTHVNSDRPSPNAPRRCRECGAIEGLDGKWRQP